ncbi:MAG TPA: hypothetical protein VKF82_03045 [Candidatus Eremiobacteraceae bacterium]|nr:hypothetical protein [Candidatus Eremiobacteraceae bacterium]
MNASFLRVLATPAPSARIVDAVTDALAASGGRILIAAVDPDMDCAVWDAEVDRPAGAAASAAAALRVDSHARLHFFGLSASSEQAPDEAALCAMLGETLDAPVYAARRAVPASQWVADRPFVLRIDGFSIARVQADYLRPGGRGLGVAVELGPPTLWLKAMLHAVPGHALSRICDAAGGPRGGLAHIGAYPGVSARSGAPFLLIECSDPSKSPLTRALEIVDIEAARYGGSIGATALLSHVPLDALLGTLAGGMPLHTQPAQVIETHLTRPAR